MLSSAPPLPRAVDEPRAAAHSSEFQSIGPVAGLPLRRLFAEAHDALSDIERLADLAPLASGQGLSSASATAGTAREEERERKTHDRLSREAGLDQADDGLSRPSRGGRLPITGKTSPLLATATSGKSNGAAIGRKRDAAPLQQARRAWGLGAPRVSSGRRRGLRGVGGEGLHQQGVLQVARRVGRAASVG